MRSRSLWIFALAAVASHSTTVGRRVKPAILDISGHTATPKRSNPIGSSVDRDIKDIEEILASVARQQESPRDYYSEYRYAEARKQSGHKKKENRERNREGSYSTVKTHEATDNANHMQHIHSASSEAVKGNIISQMSREMETLVRLQNQQIQKDHANRPSEITRQVQNVSVPKIAQNLDQDNNMEDNSTSLGIRTTQILRMHEMVLKLLLAFTTEMKSVVAKHLEFLQRNLSAVVDKETVLERKFKGAMKELKMREQNIKEEILDVKAFASQPGEES
eukprot:jgi/Bigna1/70891/fgenesh1_pg.13_\